MIGPAYKAVAERYAKDEPAIKVLSEKIVTGGGSNASAIADAPSTRRFARGSRSPGEVDSIQQ